FFFQAEDGIRDRNVTGVQTCALPICSPLSRSTTMKTQLRTRTATVISAGAIGLLALSGCSSMGSDSGGSESENSESQSDSGKSEIGRASCRERVEIVEVGGALKSKE